MSNEKFGKYRALVIDNQDPEKRGRIRVKCPAIYRESLSPWCEACLPFVSVSSYDIQIPLPNDQVWVEFEGGNVNKPIYTGGWITKSTPVPNPNNRMTKGSLNLSGSLSISDSLSVGGIPVALITDIPK